MAEEGTKVSKRDLDHFRGCLMGGAIGDAMGWPVEFLCYHEIQKKFGINGINELVLNSAGVAEITDDTQLTLFTAEGILRSEPNSVYYAYLRWLHTQGFAKFNDMDWIYDSYLSGIPELNQRRAPGNTCVSALLSRRLGTIDDPINNSKGCGGVMRIAPAGLYYPRDIAFEMAVDMAALTHGHPSGYLSAGTLSYLIATILEGYSLESALHESFKKLSFFTKHGECCRKLELACELSFQEIAPIDAIRLLGDGWVGEEALAISIYCSLHYQDNFRQAIIASVNHDGDSDSTGAITGNILGAYLGLTKIPETWVQKIELKKVIIQMADDLLKNS